MSIQRLAYDKNGLGYLINMSRKKPEIITDLKEKKNPVIRLNISNPSLNLLNMKLVMMIIQI